MTNSGNATSFGGGMASRDGTAPGTPTPPGVSVLDGGPPVPLDVADLGETLVRAAARERPGEQRLRFVRADGSEEGRSYGRLLDDAARILGGLRAAGVRPGETVVLQVADDPELLTAFWACVLGGFVPMPVNAGATAEQRAAAPGLLHRVWDGYGAPRVVTGPGQEPAPAITADPRWAGAWLGSTRDLLAHAPDRDRYRADTDAPAVRLLTSGSTGVPKAVELTHRNVLSRTAATARVNRLHHGTHSFNWMPLDHVGGLVMFHARDVYLGCHQVHARFDWVLGDPLRWLAAMDRHRSDTTWAPNFAFGLINDQADRLAGRAWDLSRVRYIMNGGEAVRSGVVRRFLEVLAPFGLPSDAMHPGWGMSETSAGVADCEFSAVGAGDERHVPVGRPQPGTVLRVVDDRDEPVPLGDTGHLQVSGTAVTSGYYRNEEQNRASFTADGWFRSGDLAYVRDGILTVTGRASDVILLDGVPHQGHEIEARVEELDCVVPSYTVACGVSAADGAGEELAVAFHPREGVDPAEARERVRARVADSFGVRLVHAVPVTREDVPKTGIGKLRRAQLRQWLEESGAVGRSVAEPASA
ncbi:AMP-binding protein [Streptomyces sp. SID8352]|uniref:AMP-binding protein n=1 Tax=Streptomyces sp. SID8352 TaxID=2690338 RepID=UPI00136BAEEE|nr:AMP-binding protein [Streptomyces sp. SID8352]MYU25767.1 AMP-binding protein [Streptomyces sp. SID8352]